MYFTKFIVSTLILSFLSSSLLAQEESVDFDDYFKKLNKTIDEGDKFSLKSFDDEFDTNITKPIGTNTTLPKIILAQDTNVTKQIDTNTTIVTNTVPMYITIKNNKLLLKKKVDKYVEYQLIVYLPLGIHNGLDMKDSFLDNVDMFFNNIKDSYDQIIIRFNDNIVINYVDSESLLERIYKLNKKVQKKSDFHIIQQIQKDVKLIDKSDDHFDMIYFNNFTTPEEFKIKEIVNKDKKIENLIFVSLDDTVEDFKNDINQYKIDTITDKYDTFQSIIDMTK